jgi:hypothetical protein
LAASNTGVKAQRPAVLAISIGLVLAAVLAVMGILRALAPDREALRAELSHEIDLVEALPANDPVRKDRRIEELLAVEDYQTHARALWLRLERLHGPVHQAARSDEAARKTVPPFLARCTSLEGLALVELRRLEDEARSLQDLHGATRYGPALVQVRDRLAKRTTAALPGCNDTDHFRLLLELQKDRIEGRYAQALRRVDDAERQHLECSALLVRLREEREAVLRSGGQAAQKLLTQARTWSRAGQKDEAAHVLDRELPRFKGLPEAPLLQALLTELLRP